MQLLVQMASGPKQSRQTPGLRRCGVAGPCLLDPQPAGDPQRRRGLSPTEGQETISRRILEYWGLPSDDRVLHFHETNREVLTLSREQVSQPLYGRSVGRFRDYEPHLGPFRAVEGQRRHM